MLNINISVASAEFYYQKYVTFLHNVEPFFAEHEKGQGWIKARTALGVNSKTLK